MKRKRNSHEGGKRNSRSVLGTAIKAAASIIILTTPGYGLVGMVWDGSSSWSGDGVLTTPIAEQAEITGFSGSGTASQITMRREGSFVNYTVDLIPFDSGLAHSADLLISDRVVLENFVNVKGFSITANFDEFIAPGNASSTFPLSISLTGSGTESVLLDHTNFNFVEIVEGSSPTVGQLGLIDAAEYYSRQIDTTIGVLVTPVSEGILPAGTTTYGITDRVLTQDGSFAGLMAMEMTNTGDFFGNGLTSTDMPLQYVNKTRFDVMDEDSLALDSTAQFRFTIEGSQFSNAAAAAAAIPEPSGALLFALGSIFVLGRRKRG